MTLRPRFKSKERVTRKEREKKEFGDKE